MRWLHGQGPERGGEVTALAYIDMVGNPAVGDDVLLNITALDLELGTGGYAIVAGDAGTGCPPIPTGPGTWSRRATPRCR